MRPHWTQIRREEAAQLAAQMGKANITHGMTDTREYEAWHRMRQRCMDENHPLYADYGGRGIKICERWNDFALFYADMGPRPSDQHSIDRFPDQNGNYEPGNCRWATSKEQQRNRRDNILVTFNGKTQCVSAWAEEIGVTRDRLWKRLFQSKWSIEKALTTPPMMRGGKVVQARKAAQCKP